MEQKDVFVLLKEGIATIDSGDTAAGLACFEKISGRLDDHPLYCSYRAVCLAIEKGEVEEALILCRYAIAAEPKHSVHYLNLGRVHLAGGMKTEAIRAFRDGLLYEWNDMIAAELSVLGWRKVPPVPSLGREHPVNRFLGKLGRKLGVR